MKKKLDKIIVVDLEATCWDDGLPRITEITEFGICAFNVQTEEISEKGSVFVKNRKTDISEYCTNLTGITQDLLDREGLEFAAAINRIVQQWGTPSRTWASWGEYDRIKVQNECALMNVRYPFSHRHINLKTLFAVKYKLKKECGLDKALAFCGLPMEGRHHSGADDAYNTARLMPYVLGDKRAENKTWPVQR